MFYNIHEIEMMHKYKVHSYLSKTLKSQNISDKKQNKRDTSSLLYKIGETLIIIGRRLQVKAA